MRVSKPMGIAVLTCMCFFGSGVALLADGGAQTAVLSVQEVGGTPLPEATVAVLSAGGQSVKATAVGDGTFYVTGVGGKVTLEVDHSTYGTALVDLELPAEPKVLINVEFVGPQNAVATIVAPVPPAAQEPTLSVANPAGAKGAPAKDPIPSGPTAPAVLTTGGLMQLLQGSDNCSGADAISGSGTYAFDTTTATTDGPTHAACLFFGNDQIYNDVWFCWTSDCDGDVTIDMCGGQTTLDTKMAVYDGCSCPPTDANLLDCNDDTCGLQSEVTFTAVSGNTYLIRIGSYSSFGHGSGTFTISCSGGGGPGGDTCATATVIGSLPFSTTGTTVGFANDYDEVCPYSGSTSPDVVFEYTPPSNTTVDISLCANSAYDTKVYVYAGSCPSAPVACNDDSCSTPSFPSPYVSSLSGVSLTGGTTYYIVVDGYAGASGTFTLDITEAGGGGGDCTTGVGCQLPDQQGHGASGTLLATSDDNPTYGYRVAENFQATASGSITSVCWWGGYYDFTFGSDCGPGPGDAFTITYYNDDAGGSVPGSVKAGPFPVTLTVKAQTGANYIGILNEWVFEASHAAVAVSAGECVWISIVNNTGSGTCAWLWGTAPPGDNRAAQTDASGTIWAATDYDMAFCVDVGIEPNGCGAPPACAGDTCADALSVPGLPFSDTGSTDTCNNTYDEVCPYSGSTSPDRVYAFTPSSNVSVDISLCTNSAYDTKLYVYQNTCPGTVVGCNDDACTTPSFPSPYVSLLEGVSMTAGNTYYIVVDGYGGDSGTYTIDITAAAGPCDVVCPGGGIPEGEPDCYDNYTDNFNGGCNSTPPVYSPINCGDTVCGTAGTYLYFGSSYRDTDWYELTLTEPMEVTWDVEAEFPVMIAMITPGSPSPCTGFTYSYALADECEPVSLTDTFPAGTYWLFVAPDGFSGIPCGLEYVGTVTCTPTTVCDGSVNDLCEDAIGPLAVPSMTEGCTTNATTDYGFPSPCGGGTITSPGVWYTVMGTGNTMTATTCGPFYDYDTKINVYCKGCVDTTCVDGNDDDCVGGASGLLSTVTWCSQAGAEYLILVHGFGGATGDFELYLSDDGVPCSGAVECLPPTGACCDDNGDCIGDMTEDDCFAAGGNNWHEGESCVGGGPAGYVADDCKEAFEDISGTGTPLSLGDDQGQSVPIGFTFNFYGDDHTDVAVCSNGYLTWSSDWTDYTNDPIPSTIDPDNFIAPFWDDLRPPSGGTIHYQTLGSAPNRRFIAQWTDIPEYYSTGANTFQAILYEGSNCIQFRYGPFTADLSGTDVTVGIENQDGSDGLALDTSTISEGDCRSICAEVAQPFECPIPTGACCYCDEDNELACAVMTEADCLALDGNWQGKDEPCQAGGGAVVYDDTPNLPIPDCDPAGVSHTITVPDSFSITDLDVDLTIDHTWLGDLCVTLTHGGTTVTLIQRPGADLDCGTGCCGCSNNNYAGIILDDEGTGGSIEDQCVLDLTSPPNYTPAEALSAFDGMDAAGDWTIFVNDGACADTGTLVHWSLHLEVPAGPNVCEANPDYENKCVIELPLDIKPGSCPNPFNRRSNGVLPVGLLGTTEVDITGIDIGSIRMSRADGVGGAVAPHEGPPGPHSVFADVGTPMPEGSAPCDCHELGGDGITDLNMKFRTQTLVDVLELDSIPFGGELELLVTGQMLDGTPIEARDCVLILAPVMPRNFSVDSNQSDVYIEVTPADLGIDADGFTTFDRCYFNYTTVTVTAPDGASGKPFSHWRVNGVNQPRGQRAVQVTIDGIATLEAVYKARSNRMTPVIGADN